MEQVPLRRLNQHTAQVLARVEEGESVEVTRRGRVIGRIVPVTGAAGELDDWIAQGRAVPATAPGPWVPPAGPATEGPPAGELVRALRDEERW
jgi:prevent-host-death family protein